MSRPGYILDVEHTTPPVFCWRGEQFSRQQLPTGSRVIYSPEPCAALDDPKTAIAHALAQPSGDEPLRALLNSETKLTIAVDDISTPTPSTHGLDNRQRVIEAVLDLAVNSGVDDVEIVVARGLRRRLSESELRQMLGYRVYESFGLRNLLHQHDAEDSNNLVAIGTTSSDEPVEINKRVADSDLLVYVSVAQNAHQGGWKAIVSGLSSYRSLTQLGNPEALDDAVAARVGAEIQNHVKLFHIETTLNNNVVGDRFAFAQKRESEWSITDRASYHAYSTAARYVPPRAARQMLRTIRSPQAMNAVFAGQVDRAHEQALEDIHRRQGVSIEGQSDVLSLAVPGFGPYSVNSIMNPILAAASAANSVASVTKLPLVRDGGALIIHHPMRPEFDGVHHPSYADFFNDVLGNDDIPAQRARFADDNWFRHLYRNTEAFHGTHPFHVWDVCRQTFDFLGGVIVVGGDTNAVRQLGFKPASTFDDALEMTRDITGQVEPSLTHIHNPPALIADVH